MFCKECGSKLNDNDVFCNHCGAKTLSAVAPEPERATKESAEANSQIPASEEKMKTVPKKPLDKKKISILAVIAAAVIVAIVVFVQMPSYTTINPHELYTIEFEGLDGEGNTNIQINEEMIEKIAAELMEENGGSQSNGFPAFMNSLMDFISDVDNAAVNAIYSIEFEIVPDNNLSNGDEVAVSVTYDEELLKEYKIKLRNAGTPAIYTVEGLTVPESIDIFEGLDIAFEGISPFLTSVIDTSDCLDFVKDYVEFSFEEQYFVNGKTYTLTAYYNENAFNENLLKVVSDTKEITVENAAYYLDSSDGVDIAPLIAQIEDTVAAYATGRMGDNYFADWSAGYSYVYNGNASKNKVSDYMISLKNAEQMDGNYNYNRFMSFYDYVVQFENTDQYSADYGTISSGDVYIVIYANNLYVDAEGALHWDLEMGKGTYDNWDNMLNDCVTANSERYSIAQINSAEGSEAA